MKIRNGLINFSLLFFSIFVALLLGELLVRSIYGIRAVIHESQNPMGSLYEHDVLIGWRKKANYKGEISSAEYSAIYKTNSKGLRGPEYSYEKKENTFRILILGDSFTDGYCVDVQESFSTILSDQLNIQSKNNQTYEVINTGVAGYSSDQEWLYYKNEGYKYNPDLVVLMYYENDHHQNMMPFTNEHFKPYVVLENDSLAVKGLPISTSQAIENENQKEWGYDDEIALYTNPSGVTKIKVWMFFNSQLYRLIAEFMRTNEAMNTLAIQLGWMTPNVKPDLSTRKEVPYYNIHVDPFLDYAWKLEAILLQELKAEIKNNHGQFLLFHIPHRMEVYDEEWERFKLDFNLDDQYDAGHIAQCIKRICVKDSIDFIYPVTEFRKKAKDISVFQQRLYYIHDVHWNENGHHLAGEVLADYISKKYN